MGFVSAGRERIASGALRSVRGRAGLAKRYEGIMKLRKHPRRLTRPVAGAIPKDAQSSPRCITLAREWRRIRCEEKPWP
jgi:hypothetical protein